MSSPSAIQHGRYYHIFNRGNNRENIFLEKRNYQYFLKQYERYISRVADTYAYCLLRNHFHLLVRIKDMDELAISLQKKKPGLIFGNFFNAYTKAFNQMYNRSGSLFETPFERVEVTSNAKLFQLVVYIHQNPQKHGFIDDFRDWPYSSYQAIAGGKSTQLRWEDVIDWFGDQKSFESSHELTIDESQISAIKSRP